MAKRGKNKGNNGKPHAPAKGPVATTVVEKAAMEVVAEVDAAAEQYSPATAGDSTAFDASPVVDVAETETEAEAEAEAEAATSVPGPAKPERAAIKLKPRDRRSPYLVLADYEQRSLAHVAGLPEQLDAPGLWRGVAYRIGSHRLASGFDEVVEIMPLPALTPVPGSQPWMLGVANVRGTLLPVVDLKQFLEGERTVLHESQRVLVVRQSGGDVAITVDEMYGQRSFVDAQGVDVAPIAEGRYVHFVDRAYRMNDQDWAVFSLDRLSRTPEFRQAAA